MELLAEGLDPAPAFLFLISLSWPLEESSTEEVVLPRLPCCSHRVFILANSTDSVPEAEETQLQERLISCPHQPSFRSSHLGGRSLRKKQKTENKTHLVDAAAHSYQLRRKLELRQMTPVYISTACFYLFQMVVVVFARTYLSCTNVPEEG